MEKKVYKLALAGNPNCGKTTIFNILSGAREKIGNWPGTTVEIKEGEISIGEKHFLVVDLPGIYSLSTYSIDEKVARDYLVLEKPHIVVAILDASQLERNLYLTLQLLEMSLNVIIVLNKFDLAKKNGIEINVDELSRILNVPVVTTIADRNIGISFLKEAMINYCDKKREKPLHIDYGDIDDEVHKLESFLSEKNLLLCASYRTSALKLLEQDPILTEKVAKYPYYTDIKNLVAKAQAKLNKSSDLESYILEKRYAYIRGLVKECVKEKITFEKRINLSDKIDKVVTNSYLGIPIFFGLMFLLFTLVFKFGNPIANFLDFLFSKFGEKVSLLVINAGFPSWLASFLSDGVISGVGNVVVFLPYILLLFFGISCLEDSGYLARGAFIMDRFMHTLGLHGKSFIPMLLGFGCTIPGIMSARTLDSEKDRIITILILPLISCSARFPVYSLFAAAFFPRYQNLVVFSLYILGIVLAIFMAQLFKKSIFKSETAPLVIELPPYRIPNWKNILIHMWIRAYFFLKKAGTIIFSAVVIVWILASLPIGVKYASEESIIGKIGCVFAPILKPAGFGDWKSAVALITGVIAKENVVGTLGTLYGGVEGESLKTALQTKFTPLSAYAFLVMTLIYIPCVATIATIKNELNWKWALFAASYTLILGWIVSVLLFQIGSLFIT